MCGPTFGVSVGHSDTLHFGESVARHLTKTTTVLVAILCVVEIFL